MAESIVCNNCRYFLVGQNDRMGVCRRYPTYQNRASTEWCGEHSSPMLELPVVDVPQIEQKRRGRPKRGIDLGGTHV